MFQAKLYGGKQSLNHLSQVKPKRTKLSRSFLFLNCFLNPKMTDGCRADDSGQVPADATVPLSRLHPHDRIHTHHPCLCATCSHMFSSGVPDRISTPHTALSGGRVRLSDVLTAANLHQTHMSFKGQETVKFDCFMFPDHVTTAAHQPRAGGRFPQPDTCLL